MQRAQCFFGGLEFGAMVLQFILYLMYNVGYLTIRNEKPPYKKSEDDISSRSNLAFFKIILSHLLKL
jgi:hypothetical protein